MNYAEILRKKTLEELVEAFNREVGVSVPNNSRFQYLQAMREEFNERKIDCSEFSFDGRICWKYELELEGDCVRIKFPENFKTHE